LKNIIKLNRYFNFWTSVFLICSGILGRGKKNILSSPTSFSGSGLSRSQDHSGMLRLGFELSAEAYYKFSLKVNRCLVAGGQKVPT
jgi:hypothetical protein